MESMRIGSTITILLLMLMCMISWAYGQESPVVTKMVVAPTNMKHPTTTIHSVQHQQPTSSPELMTTTTTTTTTETALVSSARQQQQSSSSSLLEKFQPKKDLVSTMATSPPNNVYRFQLVAHQHQQQQLQKRQQQQQQLQDRKLIQQYYQHQQQKKNNKNNNNDKIGTTPSQRIVNYQQQAMVAAVGKNNDDKNWLLTKAWLIDNINKLRREMNNLERDYSEHLDLSHRDQQYNQKQLFEDVAKLRADHQFLSQQQKQIIYLIKKNNHFKTFKELKLKSKMPDAAASLLLHNNNKIVRPLNKRDLSNSKNLDRLLVQPVSTIPSERFARETKQNMKEVFAELSSLHDISLMLFDNVKSLEKKIDFKDRLLLDK